MNPDDDENDFNFDYDDLSEEEKEELERQQQEEDQRVESHPLNVQANEILHMIDVLIETSNNSDMKEMYGSTLRDSAMIIITKLASGLSSDSYQICMQKAAIIRDHGEYLRLSNHMLDNLECFDPKYVKAFREEMEKFRELFIEWAKEIHQMSDEVDDEWGLFNKPR
jgi:hypothetical protein